MTLFFITFLKKETLEENSPKLEEIVDFYLNNQNKVETSVNMSENSNITFRSNDSSLMESSNQSSVILSDSVNESDDSPIGKKRKRKDSRNDTACMPSNKRSK